MRRDFRRGSSTDNIDEYTSSSLARLTKCKSEGSPSVKRRIDPHRLMASLFSTVLITSQVAAPLAALAQSAPQSLDLSSTEASASAHTDAVIQVGGSVGSDGFVSGGSSVNVSQGQMLTPAQLQAVNQVLSGGQTLLLAPQGQAVGGHTTIQAAVQAQGLSNLVVPTNVSLASVGFNTANPLNISGSANILGSLYALQTAPGATAVFNIADLTIGAGGLLSGNLPSFSLPTAAFASSGMTLNIVNNLTNYGTITTPGTLAINAGGSVVNQSMANFSTATMAAQAINILSNAGQLVNSGLITANANLNIQTLDHKDLLVNNIGGVLQSINDAISFRDASYVLKQNLALTGGDVLSSVVNLNGGNGTVNVSVDNASGLLNVTAGSMHLGANGGDLQLGNVNVSGDPIIYNTAGSITFGNLSFNSADLILLAAGSISKGANPTNDITLGSVAGMNSGSLTAVAGAAFTVSGAADGGVQQGPTVGGTIAGATFTVTGASGQVGDISLGSISTMGLTSGANGGNVTLVAYKGTVATTNITTSGAASSASNGNVSIIAGAAGVPGGGSITTLNVNTAGPAPSKGSVSMVTAAPTMVGGNVVFTAPASGDFWTTSNSFAPDYSQLVGKDGSIVVGFGAGNAIQTDGGNIQLMAGDSLRFTGNVSSSAIGKGDAGSIQLIAGAISSGIVGTSYTPGIISLGLVSANGGTDGNGGNILIAGGTTDLMLTTIASMAGPVGTVGGKTGGNIYIISSGNVTANTINTGGPSGNAGGGNLFALAGVNYTVAAAANSFGNQVTLTGDHAVGGNLTVSDATTSLLPGGVSNGGNIQLGAFGQSFTTRGQVTLSKTSVGGQSSGLNGNVSVFATAKQLSPGASLAVLSPLDTGTASGGGGNIFLTTAKPFTAPIAFNFAASPVPAFTFDPATITDQSSIFVQQALTSNGGNIVAISGGSIDLSNQAVNASRTAGSGNGGNIQLVGGARASATTSFGPLMNMGGALSANAKVTAAGESKVGGVITLVSGSGSPLVLAGLIQSNGASNAALGGSGGSVNIIGQQAVTVSGDITVNGAGQSGNGGNVFAISGSVFSIDSATNVTATAFTSPNAGGGTLTINSKIDARNGSAAVIADGGSIQLAALPSMPGGGNGSVIVNSPAGGMRVDGSTSGKDGTITILGSSGVAVTTALNTNKGGTGGQGKITIATTIPFSSPITFSPSAGTGAKLAFSPLFLSSASGDVSLFGLNTNGGEIVVISVGDLQLNNQSISSSRTGAGVTGNGGNIELVAGASASGTVGPGSFLAVGSISADAIAFGAGASAKGGNILLASGSGSALVTDIISTRGAASGGAPNGGDGGRLVVVSANDIVQTKAWLTNGAAGPGGNVFASAGTSYILLNAPFPGYTNLVSITGALPGGPGGNIVLNQTINSKAAGSTAFDGGSVQLSAFAGTTFDTGRVVITTPLSVAAVANGTDGSITAIGNAGAGGTPTIQAADLSTTTTAGSGGAITLATALPFNSAIDADPVTGSMSASIGVLAGNLVDGSMTLGNLTTHGANITVLAGNAINSVNTISTERMVGIGPGGNVVIAASLVGQVGLLTPGPINTSARTAPGQGFSAGSVVLASYGGVNTSSIIANGASLGASAGHGGAVSIISGADISIGSITTQGGLNGGNGGNLLLASGASATYNAGLFALDIQTATGQVGTVVVTAGLTTAARGSNSNGGNIQIGAFGPGGAISILTPTIDTAGFGATGTDGSFTAIAGSTGPGPGISLMMIDTSKGATGGGAGGGSITLGTGAPLTGGSVMSVNLNNGSTATSFSFDKTSVSPGAIIIGPLTTNGAPISVNAGAMAVISGDVRSMRNQGEGAAGPVSLLAGMAGSGSLSVGLVLADAVALAPGSAFAGSSITLGAADTLSVAGISANAAAIGNPAAGGAISITGKLVQISNSVTAIGAGDGAGGTISVTHGDVGGPLLIGQTGPGSYIGIQVQADAPASGPGGSVTFANSAGDLNVDLRSSISANSLSGPVGTLTFNQPGSKVNIQGAFGQGLLVGRITATGTEVTIAPQAPNNVLIAENISTIGGTGAVVLVAENTGSTVIVPTGSSINASGAITINTARLSNDGSLISTASGTAINVVSKSALDIVGNGAITASTGAGNSISLVAQGPNNALRFQGNQVIDAGAAGKVSFKSQSAGGQIQFDPGTTQTIQSGSSLNISTPNLFLGGTALVFSAATALTIDSGPGANNLAITSPDSASSSIDVNGGSIGISATAGKSVLFFKSPGPGTTSMFFDNGDLTVTASGASGDVSIAPGVTISSNRNITVNVNGGKFVHSGVLTSSNAGGSIVVQSSGLLNTMGIGSITQTGGSGTITLSTGGSNIVTLGTTFTLDAGALGTVVFAAPDPGASIISLSGSTTTVGGGSAISITTPSFLPGAGSVVSASSVTFNGGASASKIVVPDSGTATLATTGGAITITAGSGSDITLTKTAGGGTGVLNLNGGPVAITGTGAANIAIDASTTVASDSDITVTLSTGTLTINGLVTSSKPDALIQLVGGTQLNLAGSGSVTATGGGAATILLSATTLLNLGSPVMLDPGAGGIVRFRSATVTTAPGSTVTVGTGAAIDIKADTLNLGAGSVVSASAISIGRFSVLAMPIQVVLPDGASATLQGTNGVTFSNDAGDILFSKGAGPSSTGTLNIDGQLNVNGTLSTSLRVSSGAVVASNNDIMVNLTHSGSFIVGGLLTSSKPGGSIILQGQVNPVLSGAGSITQTGGGSSLIRVAGQRLTVLPSASLTLDAGSGGKVELVASSNPLAFSSNANLMVTGGSALFLNAPTINFDSNSKIIGSSTIALAPATPGNLTVNALAGSSTLQTSGGGISITGSSGSQLYLIGPGILNMNGGPASINLDSGIILGSTSMQIRSDNDITFNMNNSGQLSAAFSVVSSKTGGTIRFQSIGTLGMTTFGTVSQTGGGTIVLDAAGLLTVGSGTFDTGASGNISWKSPTSIFVQGDTLIANGSPLSISTPLLNFQTNGSEIIASAASTISVSSASNLSVRMPSNLPSGITTAGGKISFFAPGAITFQNTGGSGDLRFNAGATGSVSVATGTGGVSILSGLQFQSDSPIQFTPGSGMLVNNGSCISTSTLSFASATDLAITGTGTINAGIVDFSATNGSAIVSQGNLIGTINGTTLNAFSLDATVSGLAAGKITSTASSVSLNASGTVTATGVITAGGTTLIVTSKSNIMVADGSNLRSKTNMTLQAPSGITIGSAGGAGATLNSGLLVAGAETKLQMLQQKTAIANGSIMLDTYMGGAGTGDITFGDNLVLTSRGGGEVPTPGQGALGILSGGNITTGANNIFTSWGGNVWLSAGGNVTMGNANQIRAIAKLSDAGGTFTTTAGLIVPNYYGGNVAIFAGLPATDVQAALNALVMQRSQSNIVNVSPGIAFDTSSPNLQLGGGSILQATLSLPTQTKNIDPAAGNKYNLQSSVLLIDPPPANIITLNNIVITGAGTASSGVVPGAATAGGVNTANQSTLASTFTFVLTGLANSNANDALNLGIPTDRIHISAPVSGGESALVRQTLVLENGYDADGSSAGASQHNVLNTVSYGYQSYQLAGRSDRDMLDVVVTATPGTVLGTSKDQQRGLSPDRTLALNDGKILVMTGSKTGIQLLTDELTISIPADSTVVIEKRESGAVVVSFISGHEPALVALVSSPAKLSITEGQELAIGDSANQLISTDGVERRVLSSESLQIDKPGTTGDTGKRSLLVEKRQFNKQEMIEHEELLTRGNQPKPGKDKKKSDQDRDDMSLLPPRHVEHEKESLSPVAYATPAPRAAMLKTMQLPQAIVKHSGDAELSLTSEGTLNAQSGDYVVHVSKPTSLKVGNAVVSLVPNTIVLVSKHGDAINISNLWETKTQSVKVMFAGKHFHPAAGEECIITPSRSVNTLMAKGALARRNIHCLELGAGHNLTLSEISLASLMSTNPLVTAIYRSRTSQDKQIIGKVSKMYAALNVVTASHGAYSSR